MRVKEGYKLQLAHNRDKLKLSVMLERGDYKLQLVHSKGRPKLRDMQVKEDYKELSRVKPDKLRLRDT